MPPQPNGFHIVGEIYVPNPGLNPILAPREPQGTNPKILMLDLHLVQQAGHWPQIAIWVPARYDKLIGGDGYEEAQVFCGDTEIASVPVQIVLHRPQSPSAPGSP